MIHHGETHGTSRGDAWYITGRRMVMRLYLDSVL